MAQGVFMRQSVSKRAGRPFSLGRTSKLDRVLMRLPWSFPLKRKPEVLACFTMENQTQPEQITLSTAGMQTVYSNMVRGLMTAEEVILDFGLNPNLNGKIVDEPVNVTNRVVMSLASAARLHQLLQAMLTRRQQAVQEAQAASSQPKE